MIPTEPFELLISARKEVPGMINEAFALYESDPEKCIEISKAALAMSEKAGFEVGRGAALLHIGLGLFALEKYTAALQHYESALASFRSQQHTGFLIKVLINKGRVHSIKNQGAEALQCYQEILSLVNPETDPRSYIICSNNIAVSTHVAMSLQDKLASLQQTLDLAMKHRLNDTKAMICNNICICYASLGSLDTALLWGQKALCYSRKYLAPGKAASAHRFIAKVHLIRADRKKAIIHLEQAIHLAKQFNRQQELCQSYLMLSRARSETPELCLELLTLAEEIAKNYELTHLQLEIMDERYQVCKAALDFSHALHWHEEYLQLKSRYELEGFERERARITSMLLLEQKEREARALKFTQAMIMEQNQRILAQKTKLQNAQKRLKNLNTNLQKRVEESTAAHRKKDLLLIHKSQIETLGVLIAGINHEMAQPLSSIRIANENLAAHLSAENTADDFSKQKSDRIRQAVDRLQDVTSQIRNYSRRHQQDTLVPVSTAFIVDNALSLIRHSMQQKGIRLELDLQANSDLQVVPWKLEQVIINLLLNAIDACQQKLVELHKHESGDAYLPCIRLESKIQGHQYKLTIWDNGVGFAQEIKYNLRQPFYTTKAEGVGLGLWVSQIFLQQFGGKLRIEARRKGKTGFSIMFPSGVAVKTASAS